MWAPSCEGGRTCGGQRGDPSLLGTNSPAGCLLAVQAQQERTPGIQPAVAAALRSGIFDGQAILSLHHITRRTAREWLAWAAQRLGASSGLQQRLESDGMARAYACKRGMQLRRASSQWHHMAVPPLTARTGLPTIPCMLHAGSAGMAVPHGVDRTVGARRHYGGDMQQAEHMRTARERLAQLACEAGIAPTFGSSKDHEWGWAQRVDAKLPGCAAVVQTMRAEFPDVKSITMGKWWAQMVGEHIKATLGSCEARRLA